MDTQTAPNPARSGRVVVVVFVAVVLLVGGYFALGMPGMGHGRDTSPHEGMAAPAERGTFTTLSSDEFAAGMGNPGVVLVNVHVPYEGEIAGTDAFVPYDRIVGDRRLPTDKNTELLLYCRSGRMSKVAGEALAGQGYTRVLDLEGGMEAWKAAGKPLQGER